MLARIWAGCALGLLLAAMAWGFLPAPNGARETEVLLARTVQPTDPVDFDHDIRPLLEDRCWKCHGEAKHKHGLRLDSRQTLLTGGESGPAAIPGNSADSLLIQLVSGKDPDRVMPDEGPELAPEQIDLLARWIDEGMKWGTAVAVPSRPPARKYELALKAVALPAATNGSTSDNPIDRLIGAYFQQHDIVPPSPPDDRLFARRAFLDIVGLPPSPDELGAFLADGHPDKRARLVRTLLADNRRYAEHWLTFWNDVLRNDYKGTGFIDGGREQITQWLFEALYSNMPYDRFVSELVNPTSKASEGFTKGIVWRGVVNASQVPSMQAAQNVSQVFLGLNLKCASCHDSFINEWKLADAYGLAAVFADQPLDISRCDRPIGSVAHAGFLYPELGVIDADAPRPDRLRQLSNLLIKRDNGRFSRTIANRLWARFLGRGLIEPVDEMDNDPWSAELLDYLAADLVDHGYDLKHSIELILTSRAYQLPATPAAERIDPSAPFAGPAVRRMTAEQFVDAVRSLTGVWPDKADAQITVPGVEGPYPGPIRSALLAADPLMLALGRPNREQVVTSRASAATTLQAIELTNGAALDELLAKGALKWTADAGLTPEALVTALYLRALNREPTAPERTEALAMIGSPATPEGVQDLLWAMTMLPEFQLIR